MDFLERQGMDMWRGMLRALAMFIVVSTFSICKDLPETGRDMWRGMLRALAMFIVRKFSICMDFPERQGWIRGEVCCMHCACLVGSYSKEIFNM